MSLRISSLKSTSSSKILVKRLLTDLVTDTAIKVIENCGVFTVKFVVTWEVIEIKENCAEKCLKRILHSVASRHYTYPLWRDTIRYSANPSSLAKYPSVSHITNRERIFVINPSFGQGNVRRDTWR